MGITTTTTFPPETFEIRELIDILKKVDSKVDRLNKLADGETDK